MMKLITKAQQQKLLENGRRNAARLAEGERELDLVPVVKLFTPDGAATWLLTEVDPEEPDIAFGLCDLGFGCPELGSVRISEIASVRGKLGLPVERDRYFYPTQTLSAFADEARTRGRIVA
tara:strand:+ start:11734 stop:12096 length:363 start_codon:yes stop_codon:yes gene_type:complete